MKRHLLFFVVGVGGRIRTQEASSMEEPGLAFVRWCDWGAAAAVCRRWAEDLERRKRSWRWLTAVQEAERRRAAHRMAIDYDPLWRPALHILTFNPLDTARHQRALMAQIRSLPPRRRPAPSGAGAAARAAPPPPPPSRQPFPSHEGR